MAEQAERANDLDALLRQGIRDLVDPAAPSDGIWSKLRRRIEHERHTQTPDPQRNAAFRPPDTPSLNHLNTPDQY